jgi:D-amino-acid dehydrogenase
MVPWLVQFARRCNEADHARGRHHLGTLGSRCFELLDEMAADGVAIELYRAPLLVAAQDRAHAQSFLDRAEPLARLGFRFPTGLLNGEEIRSLEPTLAETVTSGFVIEQHRVVDPPVLLAALRTRLLELGVELCEGTEVRDIDLDVDRPRVAALWTSTGRHECDRVVLAAGAWLSSLGRLFGIRLPVEAGKGYSFDLRPSRVPSHALMLLEPHVGCSPIGQRLRIAGTMEFSGINARLDRRRIDSIVRGAAQMLRGGDGLIPDEETLWCGLRPIAPDGLPIIDRHPTLGNVFIAGAYSMLGMTLAAPAARGLADFIVTGERPVELEPFKATRFGPRSFLLSKEAA